MPSDVMCRYRGLETHLRMRIVCERCRTRNERPAPFPPSARHRRQRPSHHRDVDLSHGHPLLRLRHISRNVQLLVRTQYSRHVPVLRRLGETANARAIRVAPRRPFPRPPHGSRAQSREKVEQRSASGRIDVGAPERLPYLLVFLPKVPVPRVQRDAAPLVLGRRRLLLPQGQGLVQGAEEYEGDLPSAGLMYVVPRMPRLLPAVRGILHVAIRDVGALRPTRRVVLLLREVDRRVPVPGKQSPAAGPADVRSALRPYFIHHASSPAHVE
mmetsp:Transcript_27532/g.50128  ORF Transcript_27532/g.50128 Transcript_27532/m.50128 type:complete len:270 (-) Transcript_27532:798-1607(-)